VDDWPGRLALWSNKSAVVTPYGSFDLEIMCPRGEKPVQLAVDRAENLASFTRTHVESIVDIAHAHFRWALRDWGEEAFKLMEIPVGKYSRSNILLEARSRTLGVTYEEPDKLLWCGISIGVKYDEEHGLGMEFDGSRIVSLNDEFFQIINGELVFND
jgi:hypothetical protein